MPKAPQYDLSSEPLLGARVEGSQSRLSLPELLAALGTADDVELTAVQPHQQHPWHAFVVQLAAILLHRAGVAEVRQDAATWQRWMLDATGCREAWCLVVPDLSKPAFMQPPVPEGKWSALKKEISVAGELDLLVTAKNHDIKMRRVGRGAAQHWASALITVQTFEGYGGAGNYGVCRMNGAYGNRPCVSVASSLRWPEWFRRHVTVALDAREQLTKMFGYTSRCSLLWLEPWDGLTSLSLEELDPYFLEVCRRVRLRAHDDRITAFGTTTKAPRVDAKVLKGVVGDLWTPTNPSLGKSLTIAGSGFGYRTLRALLFGSDWMHPPTMKSRPGDANLMLIARALARGQGGTEGYHERVVPIPRPTHAFFLESDDARHALDELSQARVERVRDVQRKVLRPALCALFQGAPEKVDLKDDRASPWVARHDHAIDQAFFESLWNAVELEPEDARLAWDREVLLLAREVFTEATTAVPLPSSHRYRVLSAAEAIFEGSARKLLPDIHAANPSPAQAEEESAHVE